MGIRDGQPGYWISEDWASRLYPGVVLEPQELHPDDNPPTPEKTRQTKKRIKKTRKAIDKTINNDV